VVKHRKTSPDKALKLPYLTQRVKTSVYSAKKNKLKPRAQKNVHDCTFFCAFCSRRMPAVTFSFPTDRNLERQAVAPFPAEAV